MTIRKPVVLALTAVVLSTTAVVASDEASVLVPDGITPVEITDTGAVVVSDADYCRILGVPEDGVTACAGQLATLGAPAAEPFAEFVAYQSFADYGRAVGESSAQMFSDLNDAFASPTPTG